METFKGADVIVTGGLGFIGSNLAIALARAGARVTIVDSLTQGDGANRENLAGVSDVTVVEADIGDSAAMRPLVKAAQYAFNLAGRVSHIDGVKEPLPDLYANTIAQLRFLEVCRYENPALRIIYTSTRQVYGKADTATVTEGSPIRPIDPNGISKFAGDAYHRVFARDFGMRTAVLRLTNTFGPRQLMRHNRQGFIPWFVRLALEGKEIPIFGDGKQTRDVTYVSDAVDALLRVAALPELTGQVYNVGSNFVHSVKEIGEQAIAAAGAGTLRTVPFPQERRHIDIGSVACDYSALTAATGWVPRTPLREGLVAMVRYYRDRLDAYR